MVFRFLLLTAFTVLVAGYAAFKLIIRPLSKRVSDACRADEEQAAIEEREKVELEEARLEAEREMESHINPRAKEKER